MRADRSNPPGGITSIPNIQGLGHRSSMVGQRVRTEGVVTRVEGRGFYLQDPTGDGDNRTSDAMFVFTRDPPTVTIGDSVQVEGTVEEFQRNDTDLSSTQLGRNPLVTTLARNVPLPKPVELGSAERPLPSGSAYEAGLAYESLEGMQVEISDSRVIGETNRFGDAYVAPEGRGGRLPVNRDGVLVGEPNKDFPGRLKLSFDRNPNGSRGPKLNVGDRLGPMKGTFFHDYGFFGLKPASEAKPIRGGRQREVTPLVGTEWGMTVASYNVENLDPKVEDPGRLPEGGRADDDVGEKKFDAIAGQIVDHLQSPDVVALQEVQDSDGTEASGNTDAAATYRALIDAIARAGGPRYEYVDRAPTAGADGGQPGGNIRVGYLYNPERVGLVEGSVERIGENDPAFIDGRKSLAAAFEFKPTGTVLHTVNNHWASKRGSTPTFRDPNLPKIVGGEQERMGQQAAVERHVQGLVDSDGDARILSVGDFNATAHEPPILAAGDGVLFNIRTPLRDRYSYIYEGVAEAIDHQFASRSLLDKVEFDFVHVNAGFTDRASDHDPSISRIDMRPPSTRTPD